MFNIILKILLLQQTPVVINIYETIKIVNEKSVFYNITFLMWAFKKNFPNDANFSGRGKKGNFNFFVIWSHT